MVRGSHRKHIMLTLMHHTHFTVPWGLYQEIAVIVFNQNDNGYTDQVSLCDEHLWICRGKYNATFVVSYGIFDISIYLSGAHGRTQFLFKLHIKLQVYTLLLMLIG